MQPIFLPYHSHDLDEMTVARIQSDLARREYRAIKRWYTLMCDGATERQSAKARLRFAHIKARNQAAQQLLRAVRAERAS